MMRLTSQDYREVLDLVYEANRCEDLDNLIRIACPSMMRMFRSECVTFHLTRGNHRDIDVMESRSFKWDERNLVEDDYYPALYRDGYYQRSPLLKKAVDSTETILKIKDTISQQDWERSDLYQYFIAPQHLYWEMFLALRWKNNLKGMLTLWRTRNQPDFESRDIEKSELLMPHLMLAVRNVSRISRINSWQKQRSAANSLESEGLIVLDNKLRPVYSNVRAREICLYLFNRMSLGAFDIERCEFPIPSCIINDCCELLDFQKVRQQLATWPKERMVFVKGGKQFRIDCSLIWKADKSVIIPQFIITLSDLTKDINLPSNLPAKFSLTRRELEIVHCIIADRSYGEIAEKLCISKLTVHTHVKNIHRKLGVRNKIELYNCVQSPTWLA